MVGFLIKRPVAVSMTFLAVLVLGLVASTFLPVSLVPDVDIPRISVQVQASGYSARELESRVMSPLRMYLMQVNGLRDLKTEARDGNALVALEFEFGTSIDLAYIEVNEQVDRATSALPPDIQRPAVIKASASDIPVFYLDITASSPQSGTAQGIMQLSAFADEVVRRRLEQLPQVAMADISGKTFPEIIIRPDMEKLKAMQLQPERIENTIRAHNVTLGNIMVRDKQYQYSVRVGTPLLESEDIGKLWLNHRGRLWQLKDLCHIEVRTQQEDGRIYARDQRAITLAIIKQADARMQDLKTELHQMVTLLREDYPQLEFTVYRDQTALLDYTLANLRQTMILGALLALGIMFLFLREARSPWLIIISVPAALIVSLLLFFGLGISLNIISLSGLILCVGMMIDNSIIVIDNITRFRQQGLALDQACIKGTHQVFRPLLSSVLTTCSVFVPLIFLGGLAGALFYDQAMAVAIGLIVSLLVAMTIIPVYYYLLYRNDSQPKTDSWLHKLNPVNYQKLYDKGFRFTMRRQPLVWAGFVLLLAATPLLFSQLKKEQLPSTEQQAVLLWVDWNENIHLEENHQRLQQLFAAIEDDLLYYNVQLGRQQFMMDERHTHSHRQSRVYLKTDSDGVRQQLEKTISGFLAAHHPRAIYHFAGEGNLFDQVFGARQAPLEVRLRPVSGQATVERLQQTLDRLAEQLPQQTFSPLPLQQILTLNARLEAMSLHNIEMTALQRVLLRHFNENQIITLMDNQNAIPVKLGTRQQNDVLMAENYVVNRDGVDVPLSLLLQQSRVSELQVITAGLEGEYFPLELDVEARELNSLTSSIREVLQQEGDFQASFTGDLFAREDLMRELLLIGVVALLLLFFILAAQFESLSLPFIVLLEVPIAMAGALLALWLAGASLNVMSMIGLVVMCGIIINDSILKIDTISRLRAEGMPLMRALHTAGHYRLKPILMTSITTICALLPFLFIKGMGGELQKPLALAVMGGLALGTLVSLYFVPLCYYYLFATRPTTLSRPTSKSTRVKKKM